MLYLTESDIDDLLDAQQAVEVIEQAVKRVGAGTTTSAGRWTIPLEGSLLALMAATDRRAGYACVKTYLRCGSSEPRFVSLLFDLKSTALVAVLEASLLGQLRTGAASGVAAKYLARSGARTLGIIGCGRQAHSQVTCIRAAVPSIEHVVASCRTRARLASFCRQIGAEPARDAHDAAAQDIVVTATTARQPVLYGEWLRPGALVCAIGGSDVSTRELDSHAIARATLVCCDSRQQSQLESRDLIEAVEEGAVEWAAVRELHDVVTGEVRGRRSHDDIVIFKSNGIAAWDLAVAAVAVEQAREGGVGSRLPSGAQGRLTGEA